MNESAAQGSESTAPEHDALTTRADVELLFGQCLLRFQAYELLMKALLAAHRVSASIPQPNDPLTVHVDDTGRKTMGSLVGDMVGSLIVPKGREGVSQATDEASASSAAMTLQIALPPDEFARIEAEHRALVSRRNSLVHHFLDDHDLRSEAGCQNAYQALLVAFEHVTRAYVELRGFAMNVDDMRSRLAEILMTPEVRDSIVTGRPHWPVAAIVQALRDAFDVLATDGWASVDAATDWITGRYPGEGPEGYGCRSWRQVIHTSGLFELQLRKDDGRRQAWYRPRVPKAVPQRRAGSGRGRLR